MATVLTFGDLRRGATAWVKEDLNRTLRVGAVAFAVSWVVNFIVITTWGAAVGNIIGGASEGAEVRGTVYMAIMSLVITSLVVYGMEAGWSDLRKSFGALPLAVTRQFREHGVRMWSIVFWGGAVTLLTSGVLAPTISAALGLGLLAFAPTAVTGLLGKVITAIWSTLIGFFAPRHRPRPPGLGGQMIGVVGSALGFLIASQATETAFQLISAAVLVGLSYFILMNTTSKTATTGAFILLGVAFWITGDGIAAALGGEGCCGEDHHHPMDAGARAAGLSAVAGLAGGIAGIAGAGVGAVLASHPQNPSTWDDDDDGGPARVTTDPLPGGPTRTTTVTLTGDEARAALDAFHRANAEGGQADIPLPEGEQWEVFVSDAEGNKVSSGHMGTRGRVTNIGGVVEGDDGSIAISVDVTTYSPTAPAPPPVAAPPAAPPAATPPPATSPAVGAGVVAAIPAADAPADATDAADTEEGDDSLPTPPSPPRLPDSGGVIEATTLPPAMAPAPIATTPQPEPASPPPAQGTPDGSDPGAYAEWVGRTAGGHMPPADVAGIGDLIRGGRDEVTISGDFTGRFGPLLRNTESRTDGVAIKFPTGDRILVRVRNGRVEVRHEASMASLLIDAVADEAAGMGLKIPRVDDAIKAATGPVDSFNRAVDTSGRTVASVTRNPDGSIRIGLKPR